MDKKIKIYALSTCIWCKKTIDYFNKCGQKFEHIYVDQLDDDVSKKVSDELDKLNPTGNFPTVIIGDKVIVGYKVDEFEKAIKK